MDQQVGIKMLYGDNMQTVFPLSAVDVSKFREIPDHQEVFTHPSSDQSIIFEILEYVNEEDEFALRTHFHDLAESNDAVGPENCQIIAIEALDVNDISIQGCRSAYLLFGQQMVAKFNESAKNAINVYMGLFRLPEKGTDIMVTMNDPQTISPQSSSHGENQNPEDKWTTDHFRAAILNLKLLQPGFLG